MWRVLLRGCCGRSADPVGREGEGRGEEGRPVRSRRASPQDSVSGARGLHAAFL